MAICASLRLPSSPSAAYGDWDEFRGAASQLCINLAAIVVAGVITLGIQRAFYLRRRRASRS